MSCRVHTVTSQISPNLPQVELVSHYSPWRAVWNYFLIPEKKQIHEAKVTTAFSNVSLYVKW